MCNLRYYKLTLKQKKTNYSRKHNEPRIQTSINTSKQHSNTMK